MLSQLEEVVGLEALDYGTVDYARGIALDNEALEQVLER
jgi:hypothetical protein